MTKKILIVEDDDHAYEDMQRALEEEAAWRLIAIDIRRVKTLNEGKRALSEFNPDIVSTDMMYPKMDGRPIEPTAGAHFVRYLKLRYPRPCLLYSSDDVEKSRAALAEALTTDISVSILKKDVTRGHARWVDALYDILASTS